MTATVTSFYKHRQVTDSIFAEYQPDRPAAPAQGECIHFSEVFGIHATCGIGYGRIWLDGKRWKTHRLMWCIKGRELPPPPFGIRHRCHNPACVNIDHLEIGTQRDNLRDATKAGRRTGVVMTQDQLVRTYRWALFGFTQKQSASFIGCQEAAIGKALRKIWHLDTSNRIRKFTPGQTANPYGRPKRYRAKVNTTMNLF